ncbi:MAG: hypothetical protein JSV65_14145 [Armatimonadota bacterium]|nr:MAG: hypothetical protein JSV65_14145 [Armatimonadota bacterium]
MRHLPQGVLLFVCILACGCARTPSEFTDPGAPKRQLIAQFTLAAPADPAFYYFVAIDTNGVSTDGPVPIVANPSAPIPATGVPLLISDSTAPPPFYLQHHQGAFFQYKELYFIGPPYQAGVSQDGLTVAVIMDLDQITTTVQQIEVNVITADRLLPPESQFIELNYDGLGPSGNSYIIIPVDVSGLYDNAGALIPEREGDTSFPALDITDWSVEVRLTG